MRGNNDWLDYLDARRSDTLEHSAKGTTWGSHKYIRKIGDRYFYTTQALQAYMKKRSGAAKAASDAQSEYEKDVAAAAKKRDASTIANTRANNAKVDAEVAAATRSRKISQQASDNHKALQQLSKKQNADRAQKQRRQAVAAVSKAASSAASSAVSRGKSKVKSLISNVANTKSPIQKTTYRNVTTQKKNEKGETVRTTTRTTTTSNQTLGEQAKIVAPKVQSAAKKTAQTVSSSAKKANASLEKKRKNYKYTNRYMTSNPYQYR